LAREFCDGSKHPGLFQIGDDAVPGELILAGRDTRLMLHRPEFFFAEAEPDLTLHGKLTDLTKVSLLGCLGAVVAAPTMRSAEQYHTANVEPRYVLLGDSHIRSSDRIIRAATFVVSDAPTIFNDHETFALAFTPDRDQLAKIIANDRTKAERTVELGKHPMVAYYTGKGEVFVAETVLGRISATHNVAFGIGGAEGVGFKNRISTRIEFPDLSSFSETINASLSILRFLEIIAGRKQTVLEMKLETQHGDASDRFQVYWPLKPVRKEGGASDKLHPLELPLDAARQPEAFAQVLTAWLARDRDRIAARVQFSDCFTNERSYSSVRLVGAANMFDLLPADSCPGDTPLTAELGSARDECQRIFRALPDSPERGMVLSALGRVGKPVLKRKIRHRAAIVTNALEKRFHHLDTVIDLAVEFRNVLVHGSKSDLDIAGPVGQLMPFLTDLLEFLFVASELIEAGWDALSWEKERLTWDHPLGYVMLSYDSYLRELDAALPESRKFLSA